MVIITFDRETGFFYEDEEEEECEKCEDKLTIKLIYGDGLDIQDHKLLNMILCDEEKCEIIFSRGEQD